MARVIPEGSVVSVPIEAGYEIVSRPSDEVTE